MIRMRTIKNNSGQEVYDNYLEDDDDMIFYDNYYEETSKTTLPQKDRYSMSVNRIEGTHNLACCNEN